jgi:hypothetical protein
MNIERPTSNIERRTPAGVLYVAPEIDLGYLVRPRMEMLGADLDRIRVVSTVSPNRIPGDPQGPRPFSVATDLPLLDKAIADDPATALVVIDPLYWMSAGLATTGGRAWRRVLDELSQIAARRNVAIVIVMSLARRGPRRAIHRLAGGLEFAETAGAIWLVVEQRDRPGWRRFVPALNRCAPELPGATAFRIHERGLQWDPRPVSITAEEALAGDGPPAPAPERDTAIDWLTGLLAEGPVSFAEVMALSRRNGIAERTPRRAKSVVEVRTRRVGFGPGSQILWCLPGHDGDWIEDSAGHLVCGGRESPGAAAACSGQPPERSDGLSFDVGCSTFDVRRSATERADGSAMCRGVARPSDAHDEAEVFSPVTMNIERPTSNIEHRTAASTGASSGAEDSHTWPPSTHTWPTPAAPENTEKTEVCAIPGHAPRAPRFRASATDGAGTATPELSDGPSFDVGCSTFDVHRPSL